MCSKFRQLVQAWKLPKKAPPSGGAKQLIPESLADLRGIAESDGEEECGNRQGEDEDVSEAFHRESPRGRSAEGGACRGHVALGKATGGTVAQFLEQTELHLFAEIRIDTGKHIAIQGPSAVPDVPEEEEQGEGGMAESEPAAW